MIEADGHGGGQVDTRHPGSHRKPDEPIGSLLGDSAEAVTLRTEHEDGVVVDRDLGEVLPSGSKAIIGRSVAGKAPSDSDRKSEMESCRSSNGSR